MQCMPLIRLKNKDIYDLTIYNVQFTIEVGEGVKKIIGIGCNNNNRVVNSIVHCASSNRK